MQRGVCVLQRFHRKSDGIVFALVLRKLGALLREPGFKLGGIADGAAAAGGVIEGALRLTAADGECVERALQFCPGTSRTDGGLGGNVALRLLRGKKLTA